jgi:hypothetical protein
VTDARAIALRENIHAFFINGAITLPSFIDYPDWRFEGLNPADDIITVSSFVNLAGSKFESCGITGDLSGNIFATNCVIGETYSTVTGLAGVLIDCGFACATLQLNSGDTIRGLGLYNLTDLTLASIVLDYDGNQAIIRTELEGKWTVTNMTSALSSLRLTGNGLNLTLQSTVTAGNIELSGYGELTDNATSYTSLTDALIRGSRIDVATSTRASATELELVDDHERGTIRINKATDPWREEHLDVEDGVTVRDAFALYDGDGVAINNANPLTDFVGERRRV